MRLEKRISNLEKILSKTYVHSDLEAELIEWFKSHPGYVVWLGPEGNNGLVMPEYLSQTFGRILNRAIAQKSLKSEGSSLLTVLDSLDKTFQGYATL